MIFWRMYSTIGSKYPLPRFTAAGYQYMHVHQLKVRFHGAIACQEIHALSANKKPSARKQMALIHLS